MSTAGVRAVMARAGWRSARPERPRHFDAALVGAIPAEELTQHDRHLLVALLIADRQSPDRIAELTRMTETVVLRIVRALGFRWERQA